MPGQIVNPPVSSENVSMLHTLNLGQHSLVLMSDGSIDVLAHEGAAPSSAKTGIHLTDEETYRLFISLHHQFQQAATVSVSPPAPSHHREVQP